MNLDDTLRLHALKLKAGSSPRLVELALDQADPSNFKQMCAKVSHQLSEEIDRICDLLDIPKRLFIELACIDALDKAQKHLDETGALDQYVQEIR